MMQFSYRARDGHGKMITGLQTAQNEEQLAEALLKKGLYLISATEKRPELTYKSRFSLFSIGSSKIKKRDIIDFTSNLATILSAGVPLLKGLQDLMNQARGTPFSGVIKDIKEDVEGGSMLHEAFAKHQKVFGETYIHIVKAGESSGSLSRVLKELVKFMEWQEELNSNIKKTSIYPIAVLSAIGILILLLFSFAFPRIANVLIQMKVQLPLSTKVFIGVSNIFRSYWYVMICGVFGFIAGIKLISRTQRGKIIIDRLKLRLPLVGDLFRKVALSRFSRHLCHLLQSGISIINALSIVEKVVGNRVIAEAVKVAREDVQAGITLSEALQKSGEFSPMVIRMISIGESTGTLTESLAAVTEYYDQEVPTTVKKFFSVLEPALILCLAFVVLAVALSIYLPIYKSITLIGK